MTHQLEKNILKLKLTLAGHISNINIKHENLEIRYVKLVKEVDELEKRIRNLEQDIQTIVYKAVKSTILILSGGIGMIYSFIKIVEALNK